MRSPLFLDSVPARRYPGSVIALILSLLTAAILLLLFLHLRSAARIRRAEARIAALQEEVDLLRGTGQPAPDQLLPATATLGSLFERLVGGRLLIWIGGIALAAAGIFLIRHSIELVSPEARMIAASLFGLLLLGAGEYARGGRLLAEDPRMGQALVGAGIAVLYATTYGSYLLFGLIGSGTASILMLLITAAALALALRHGAPTAALGLVGGFLTPLLVGDPEAGALPVLAYLALLDAAIFFIAWRRSWPWLAAAAVAASYAWTGYFILEPPHDALPAGLFAALLAIAASLPRPGEGRRTIVLQPAIIGLIELAVLAARPDIGVAGWLLFGGLAAASLPLPLVRPEQRLAPVAALLLALLVLAVTAGRAPDPIVPWAAAAITLLFAGGSAALARDRALRALTACGGLVGPVLIMRLLRPEALQRPLWGVLALALSLGALWLLWQLRNHRDRGSPNRSALAAGLTAALLGAVAAYDLAPQELVSGAWLLLSILLLGAGIRLPEKALRFAGLLLLTGTILKVFLIDAGELEGVLRIFSFLGLGVALIGIGKLYAKVLSREGGRAASEGRPAD